MERKHGVFVGSVYRAIECITWYYGVKVVKMLEMSSWLEWTRSQPSGDPSDQLRESIKRALGQAVRSGVIGVHRTFWLVVKQKLEGTRSCVIAPNTVARVRLRKHEVHLRG